MKGEKEWKVQDDLEAMGTISPPQWHKLWPIQKVPELTSPPKGRSYSHKNKKVHNISTDSESSVQDNKKQKLEDTNTELESLAQDNTMQKLEDTKKVTKLASIFTNNKHNKNTAAAPKNRPSTQTQVDQQHQTASLI